LEIVDRFILALCGNLFDVEAKILEEFVDIDVSFKYEDAPSVGSRVALHQGLKCLQVDETDVVHPSVDLADIYSKDGQLVAIERVLQEA
jgi:hypothetical protein